MAHNRYLKKEKFRRQYTLTTTKAVVAFLLSAIFSVLLSAYFERYGRIILRKVIDSALASAEDSSTNAQSTDHC